MTSDASVAALAVRIITDQQERDTLFSDWLNGSPTGGPSGDGRYPIPHPSGTVMVPCWAKVSDAVVGPAAAASASADQASASASQSAQAFAAITTIKTAINALLAEARTLKNQAEGFRQDAASEHAAARAEREACQQLKLDMQAMLDALAAANP